MTQAEAGVLCPISMTYAAVPALRQWAWLAPRDTYPRTLLAAQLAQDPATRNEAIRHYEAAARVIRAIDEMLQSLIRS